MNCFQQNIYTQALALLYSCHLTWLLSLAGLPSATSTSILTSFLTHCRAEVHRVPRFTDACLQWLLSLRRRYPCGPRRAFPSPHPHLPIIRPPYLSNNSTSRYSSAPHLATFPPHSDVPHFIASSCARLLLPLFLLSSSTSPSSSSAPGWMCLHDVTLCT